MLIYSEAIHLGLLFLLTNPTVQPARQPRRTAPTINHTVGATDHDYGNAVSTPDAYGLRQPKHPLDGWRTTDGRKKDGTAELSESDIPLI